MKTSKNGNRNIVYAKYRKKNKQKKQRAFIVISQRYSLGREKQTLE